MGEILTEYESKSKPGRTYRIIKGDDGVTYCTCWQWKINKTCKHLQHFLAHNHMPDLPHRHKEPEERNALQIAIDEAVQMMKGG